MSAIAGVTGRKQNTPKSRRGPKTMRQDRWEETGPVRVRVVELPALVIDKYSETLEFLNLGQQPTVEATP